MKQSPQIIECLSVTGARFLCLDPTGARTIETPPDLEPFDEHLLTIDSPFDLFPSDERSKVVTAFGLTRVNGSSRVQLTLRTGESVDLSMFDEVESLGCYVAVLVPSVVEGRGEANRGAQLPVRYTNYQLDLSGVIIGIDPDLERLLGWTREELIGRSALEIIHPDDQEKGILGWISLLEAGLGGQCRMRQRFQTKTGEWIWLEDTTTNHLDDPERQHVDCQLVDISDEMAAQQEAERRHALLTRLTDALPSGVLHLDQSGHPTFWNQRWLELVGISTPSIKDLLEVTEEPEILAAALDAALSRGDDADLDITLIGDGLVKFGRLHLRPLEHDDGTTEVLVTFDDMTDARVYQTQLLDQARRDPLTGLLSRFGLRDIVDELIADRRVGARSLLFIDLDRFKPINDRYGHAVGDDVLRAVGNAIAGVVRAGDSVARIGGDEFVVAVHAGSFDEVERVTERIAVAVRATEDEFDFEVDISASIGAAVVEPDDDFDTLLQRADSAMYEEKRRRQLPA